jgi:hypothetical protein
MLSGDQIEGMHPKEIGDTLAGVRASLESDFEVPLPRSARI